MFNVPQKSCSVLAIKSEIGIKIKSLYDAKDITGLKEIAQVQLPELLRRVYELKNTHKEQWFKIYKPFGWEVLDIRYGGLISRIETIIMRLNDYLEGKINIIEELEEERLYFNDYSQEDENKLVHCNLYHRIVTAGSLSAI